MQARSDEGSQQFLTDAMISALQSVVGGHAVIYDGNLERITVNPSDRTFPGRAVSESLKERSVRILPRPTFGRCSALFITLENFRCPVGIHSESDLSPVAEFVDVRAPDADELRGGRRGRCHRRQTIPVDIYFAPGGIAG